MNNNSSNFGLNDVEKIHQFQEIKSVQILLPKSDLRISIWILEAPQMILP